MEQKFYNDGFEKLLKDQADDFKMYPSSKAWHGIYNNLHPGRKWPSLAMGIMLLVSLLLVGKLNNESPRVPQKAVTENGQQSTAGLQKTKKSKPTLSTNTGNNSDNSLTPSNLTSASIHDESADSPLESAADNSTASQISVRPEITSENSITQSNGDVTNKSKHRAESQLMQVVINSPDIELNSDEPLYLAAAIESTSNDELLSEEAKLKLRSQIAIPVVFTPNEMDSSRMAELAALAKAAKSLKSRFSWKFYGSPTLTYRDFAREENDPLPPNFALAASSNTTAPANSLDHRMALGFQLGTEFLYDLSKKTKLKAGLQMNYTGYIIRAYTVHPINSNYTLLNEEGQAYSVSGLSSHSSTPGPTPVNLHNQQFQVAFPMGLETELAQSGKFHFNVAATFQPTYMIAGGAYVSSSNRKNYISQNGLLRKWNMSTGLETFVSFKTRNSITMHLGPQFRYQLLSTYSNKYPHKEHLLDFGFKIGITKPLR